jgi:hypothetical protein
MTPKSFFFFFLIWNKIRKKKKLIQPLNSGQANEYRFLDRWTEYITEQTKWCISVFLTLRQLFFMPLVSVVQKVILTKTIERSARYIPVPARNWFHFSGTLKVSLRSLQRISTKDQCPFLLDLSNAWHLL